MGYYDGEHPYELVTTAPVEGSTKPPEINDAIREIKRISKNMFSVTKVVKATSYNALETNALITVDLDDFDGGDVPQSQGFNDADNADQVQEDGATQWANPADAKTSNDARTSAQFYQSPPSPAKNPTTNSVFQAKEKEWSTPADAYTSNDAYMTATTTVEGTNLDIQLFNTFNFNIPPYATVLGVKVEIERKASNATSVRYVKDMTVTLHYDGGMSDNKAYTADKWDLTDTVKVYGGETDKWGWDAELTPTVINNSSFGVCLGAKLWTGGSNPTTAYVDAITVTIYYSFDSSYYKSFDLRLYGFGFTIPSNATIVGIEAQIEKQKSSTGSIKDYEIKLINDSQVEVGDNKANTFEWLQGSDEIVYYGGETDTWNANFSVDKINNSNFGITISVQVTGDADVQALIDSVLLKVYYTTPDPIDCKIYLPTAVGLNGKEFDIKLIANNDDLNSLTIDPSGSETIDGATTLQLTTEQASRGIKSDGTNWQLIRKK